VPKLRFLHAHCRGNCISWCGRGNAVRFSLRAPRNGSCQRRGRDESLTFVTRKPMFAIEQRIGGSGKRRRFSRKRLFPPRKWRFSAGLRFCSGRKAFRSGEKAFSRRTKSFTREPASFTRRAEAFTSQRQPFTGRREAFTTREKSFTDHKKPFTRRKKSFCVWMLRISQLPGKQRVPNLNYQICEKIPGCRRRFSPLGTETKSFGMHALLSCRGEGTVAALCERRGGGRKPAVTTRYS